MKYTRRIDSDVHDVFIFSRKSMNQVNLLQCVPHWFEMSCIREIVIIDRTLSTTNDICQHIAINRLSRSTSGQFSSEELISQHKHSKKHHPLFLREVVWYSHDRLDLCPGEKMNFLFIYHRTLEWDAVSRYDRLIHLVDLKFWSAFDIRLYHEK